MNTATKEWEKFLKLFNKGDIQSALKFAKTMKDKQNKTSALHFLRPTAAQRREAELRAKNCTSKANSKAVDKLVKKMVAHSGYMSNSPF